MILTPCNNRLEIPSTVTDIEKIVTDIADKC